MKFNHLFPHRRSIRLKNYDYSQPGAYFITICTQNRWRLFGDVANGEMVLNGAGEMVKQTWFDLPNHNSNVVLDAFVIMPNHIHGIIVIRDVVIVGAGSEPAPTITTTEPAPAITTTEPAPTHGLPELVRQFKTFSAKRVNSLLGTSGQSVWQRNYYEHIIRDENGLNRIRQYIINNPGNWKSDENYFG